MEVSIPELKVISEKIDHIINLLESIFKNRYFGRKVLYGYICKNQKRGLKKLRGTIMKLLFI